MPAPTDYHCCEMCHKTNTELDELADRLEAEGKLKTLAQADLLTIKQVLIDDNMETEMCGRCIKVLKRSGELEIEVYS